MREWENFDAYHDLFFCHRSFGPSGLLKGEMTESDDEAPNPTDHDGITKVIIDVDPSSPSAITSQVTSLLTTPWPGGEQSQSTVVWPTVSLPGYGQSAVVLPTVNMSAKPDDGRRKRKKKDLESAESDEDDILAGHVQAKRNSHHPSSSPQVLQGLLDLVAVLHRQNVEGEAARASEREKFELRLESERREWEEKRDRERREEEEKRERERREYEEKRERERREYEERRERERMREMDERRRADKEFNAQLVAHLFAKK